MLFQVQRMMNGENLISDASYLKEISTQLQTINKMAGPSKHRRSADDAIFVTDSGNFTLEEIDTMSHQIAIERFVSEELLKKVLTIYDYKNNVTCYTTSDSCPQSIEHWMSLDTVAGVGGESLANGTIQNQRVGRGLISFIIGKYVTGGPIIPKQRDLVGKLFKMVVNKREKRELVVGVNSLNNTEYGRGKRAIAGILLPLAIIELVLGLEQNPKEAKVKELTETLNFLTERYKELQSENSYLQRANRNLSESTSQMLRIVKEAVLFTKIPENVFSCETCYLSPDKFTALAVRSDMAYYLSKYCDEKCNPKQHKLHISIKMTPATPTSKMVSPTPSPSNNNNV